ncbi:MAG: hypothetical protein OXQ84_02975 [bacterium]|nr:hypothetical protein [bacterium]
MFETRLFRWGRDSSKFRIGKSAKTQKKAADTRPKQSARPVEIRQMTYRYDLAVQCRIDLGLTGSSAFGTLPR